MVELQAKLKWGKTSLTVFIRPGMTALDLKAEVQAQTGLPPFRQKLLCPKVWKGPLGDQDDLSTMLQWDKVPKNLVITLIGSTDTVQEKPLDERPKFIEDMTADEMKQMEMEQYQNKEDEGDIVDIPALQKEPGLERYDNKVGMHEYNRFVTGLPQHQINSILAKRKNPTSTDEAQLSDTLAMTLGMELRRACINSLVVLDNGTIVSGLDDGHVQMWRRCQMVGDLRHASNCVEHMLKFPSSVPEDPSFVTAGGGAISIWTQEGHRLIDVGSPLGTSPKSLTSGCVRDQDGIKFLAACFRITRETDPNQFRLVPQNGLERRRRAEAEARESMIQNELLRVSKCIKVWFYNGGQLSGSLQETTIQNDSSVVQLEAMNSQLISGDQRGCITNYNWSSSGQHQAAISVQEESRLQIAGSACTIVLMKAVRDNILAVSIDPALTEDSAHQSAKQLHVSISRGVLLIDMDTETLRAVLNGHLHTIHCICPLPNGSILTAGAKNDAKVLLWENNSVTNAIQADDIVTLTEAKQTKEPGYVFDIQVLPDSDPNSIAFAIAGARYNVIKIVI